MRETIPPLTNQESDFATQNYGIVREYLNIRRLPFDEWHDVVVFRYLRSAVDVEMRNMCFEYDTVKECKKRVCGTSKAMEKRKKRSSRIY